MFAMYQGALCYVPQSDQRSLSDDLKNAPHAEMSSWGQDGGPGGIVSDRITRPRLHLRCVMFCVSVWWWVGETSL